MNSLNLRSGMLECLSLVLAAALAGAVTMARAAEPALPALREPVTITEADLYEDGGTWYARLVDADGAVLEFCVDGRLCAVPAGGTRSAEPRPDAIFVGARHPADAGAFALAPGGPAEQRLCAIVAGASDLSRLGGCADRLVRRLAGSADH